MKKIWFFIIILGLILVPIANSAEIPDYYDKYVNDFSKMFSADETASLRNLLHEVDINTTAEVVVATIPDCGGDYDGYAVNLATKWKIGKADKDNGLLILYCLDVKRLIVKTGYGLEGILPDGKIGRYLDDYYVPLRDKNQTTAGIIAFTQEIINVIDENRDEVLSGQAGGDNIKTEPDFFPILIWIFLVYIILSRILVAAYKNKKRSSLPWFIPIFLPFPSRGSSGGFGGGGFGGGGFGGGGFGGGGASR